MLSIKNLCSQFEGGKEGFSGFDLNVEKGEIFGILGSSGAGKTTLLRLIGGHLNSQGGEVSIDDVDVTKLPPEERPTATVFQRYVLFPHLDVFGNVAFGLNHTGSHNLPTNESERVKELLSELGLTPLAGRMPGELSGGQMQRVAIARALAIRPKLLLMDEPFSALDVETRISAKRLILEVQKNHDITILIVSHDQDDIFSTCDRVAILDGFVSHQVGSPHDIMMNPKTLSVVDYLAGFEYIDFIDGVVPFYCHHSHIRMETAKNVTNGLPSIDVQVAEVNRRLDLLEVNVKPRGQESFLPIYLPAYSNYSAVGEEAQAVFTQQIRFEE